MKRPNETQQSGDIKLLKLTENQSLPTASVATTSAVPRSDIKSKYHIKQVLEALFKVSMSNDVLADITIDDNLAHNQLLIVGRAKLLGSSMRQMRHVIPYSYMEKALKKLFKKEHRGEYETYFINIINTAKLLINNKDGIALNEEEYKYIDYGIKYFKERLDFTDPYAITIICEAISRIILTMFNQDKYAAFPTEGNTLSSEIRLYTSEKDVEAIGKFQVETHNEITNKVNKRNDNLRIRIVNNEGAIVKRSIKALNIIDALIAYHTSRHNAELQKNLRQYNNDCKCDIKIRDKKLDEYNENLDENNLCNNFHSHVAKHLYFIFDFKPLEEMVLAPQEKNEQFIELYPSADGTRKSKYSCQIGKEYRDLQVNRGIAHYNKKAIFRSEMNSQQIKEVLTKKVIDCIIICLLSYDSIRYGCSGGETEEAEPGMRKVFESFIKLVQYNYEGTQSDNDEDISLNQGWVDNIRKRYNDQVNSNMLNVSIESIPSKTNYL